MNEFNIIKNCGPTLNFYGFKMHNYCIIRLDVEKNIYIDA